MPGTGAVVDTSITMLDDLGVVEEDVDSEPSYMLDNRSWGC